MVYIVHQRLLNAYYWDQDQIQKCRKIETRERLILEPRACTTAPFPRAGSAQVVRVCECVRACVRV